MDTVRRLALAAEYKDEDTGDHITRLSNVSAFLSRELGLPEKEVQLLLYAAPMQDVGKIGIPDSILLKPSMLSPEEFEVMKTHTTIGERILSNSKSRILQKACEIAGARHEKWSGRGYPRDLREEDIPLSGRIVAVVDTFDALNSRRPYKKPYPLPVVLDIIKKERGAHFDPDITDVFLKNVDSVVKMSFETQSEGHPLNPPDFTWSERDLRDKKYT